MDRTVSHAHGLRGTLLLPADKSIAHRAALFAAVADGTSVIRNFPTSADPLSTLACLKQLGIRVDESQLGEIVVAGRGRYGLRPSEVPIDCGNSGTTMRLLAGILAGAGISATLVGDASLSQRPMDRIASPLRRMGAGIVLQDGHAPMEVLSGGPLRGITYTLPVPSAQVKSCVLLAGLYATGTTTVIEPVPSRNHTERMLKLPVAEKGGARHITAGPGLPISPFNMALPADFSASAFFLVAGSVVPGASLHMPRVGLNPTRSALLDVLREMGADICVSARTDVDGEPAADLDVRYRHLRGVTIGGGVIANLIDEVPALAVAAACAAGRTAVTGARELRIKECDRIHAIVTNLRALGADVEEYGDGFAIEGGGQLTGAAVDSFMDHRIAMAMGIAGLVASGQTTISRAEVAEVSFPDFWGVLDRITVSG